MVKKRLLLLLNLTLFVFILIYFTQISPLVPFDGDDWRYIGGIRLPFPMWGVWNPTSGNIDGGRRIYCCVCNPTV